MIKGYRKLIVTIMTMLVATILLTTASLDQETF